MRFIPPMFHAILDYVTVAIFAAAPSLLGLEVAAAWLSYLLSGVHLLMTLLTDFPGGVMKVIPLTWHGWVECVVGPALVILAFVAPFPAEAKLFYGVMGAIIIVAWATSQYEPEASRKSGQAPAS